MKAKIQQVIRILFDNAIKYSPERTTVTIKGERDYQGQYNPEKIDGVLISITDQGVGVKESDMPYMFKRFYRTEDTRDFPGTGLGLAIAKEIVNMHHGLITLNSVHEQGTTFYVLLPKKPNFDKEAPTINNY